MAEELARTVAAVARLNLRRKKDEASAYQRRSRILTAFEERARNMTTQKSLFACGSELDVSYQATFVWLEELGAAFSIPLKGYPLRTYAGVKDFIVAILDHANAAVVTETLEKSQQNLGDLTIYSCVEPRMHLLIDRDNELGLDEKCRKAQFWTVLAGNTTDLDSPYASWTLRSFGLLLEMKRWQSAWDCHGDLGRWHASRFKRRIICENLLEGAEILQMLADAFVLTSEGKDVWLDLEEERLRSFYEANCRKRKLRAREEVAGHEREQFKWARHEEVKAITAEKEELEAERISLKEKVACLEVALQAEQAAGASLQLQNIDTELKEELEAERINLKEKIECLEVALEAEQAARASLQLQIDTELACQICMSRPRNVVLLPCRHGQFCSACILEHRRTARTCPICRAKIKTTINSIG